MRCSLYRDALEAPQRNRIDNIDCALRFPDRHINLPPVTSDCNVVWMAAQRNLVCDSKRLTINDIQGTFGFVADKKPASIRSRCGPMVHLNALNLSDDFIAHRIDDIDVVTSAIGL